MNFQPNDWVKQGSQCLECLSLTSWQSTVCLTNDCLFFPLCLFWYHFFWNQDFFSGTKFSETETKTLNKLAKVSKPRSFKTTLWIYHKAQQCATHIENWTQQNDEEPACLKSFWIYNFRLHSVKNILPFPFQSTWVLGKRDKLFNSDFTFILFYCISQFFNKITLPYC